MKKIILSIIILITTIGISNGQHNFDSLFTHIGYTEKIESKILNQTKTILIHIPVKFDINKEYPLIVLSDFMAFKPFSSITEIMAYNKTIPWCIVVCPMTTNVRDDYSPIINDTSEAINGGKTLDFYEKELIPFLKLKYKISKKVLWGQKYSGMFTTFTMLSRPDLFDGYFSDTPKLDLLKEKINSDDIFKNCEEKKVFYQLSWNTSEPKKESTKILLDKLDNYAPENLIWEYREDNDSIFITHLLTNYTYALDSFFKKMAE
jgi:predicted alpha/beta superfamily hydrolase